MNIINTLFFLLVTQNYATSDLDQKYQKLKNKIELCNKLNNEVIKKGIIRLENHDEFLKEEEKALKNIQSFETAKLSAKDEFEYFISLSQSCKDSEIKKHINTIKNENYHCESLFDELAYFQSLIKAVSNYNWSLKTKEIAKNKILSYFKEENQKPRELIKQAITLELIKMAIKNKIINKKHLNRVSKLQERSSKQLKLLNDKKRKMAPYEICSETHISFLNQEIPISISIQNEISLILNSL